MSHSLIVMQIIRDILEWRDGENSRVVIEFRKKLEKGIVKDEDLGNFDHSDY